MAVHTTKPLNQRMEGIVSVAIARRESVVSRVVLGSVLFGFSWFFSGDVVLPLLWFSAVLMTQTLDHALTARLIDAAPERRARLVLAFCVSTTVAAIAWSMAFVMLWVDGGAIGQVVAVLSCAGSMLHVAVVCHHSPRLFWLMILPYASVLVGPLVIGSIVTGAIPLLAGLGLLAAVFGFIANFFASYKQLRAMTLRVETARAEAERGRIEADKANAAKSAFLATMSHELRTPLNAVIGYAELLEEELADTRRAAEDASRISFAGRHLLALINDVLDLSKIEAGRVEVRADLCDVAACVYEVIATLAQNARDRGNSLTVDVEPGLQCFTDTMLLRQCLFNLVANANKFTERGELIVRVRLQAGRLAFSVSDTGIGMTSEQVSRLFQPFVQADASLTRNYGGTGLGLAITKRIAGLLGGDVAVSSEPGKGSTFTLTIAADYAAEAIAA